MPSICIVTVGNISMTPRVAKEAQVLSDAGYDVRVVFTQGLPEVARSFDEQLLKKSPWRWASVKWSRKRSGERSTYLKMTLRHELAVMLPRVSWWIDNLAEHAEGKMYGDLARVAAAERADLYIGHYPTGLAAAGKAAVAWDAMLGYDAEDYHIGELPSDERPRQTARIEFIERKYLARCHHVTASSSGIAKALADRYGIPEPVAIHNAFPWADRQWMDGKVKDRRGADLSLYWYSQVIGMDRGIQDAIRAMGHAGGMVELHLRGKPSNEIRAKLLAIARDAGVAERVYFHDPVPPHELLSRAAEHDVGLALEQGHTINRSIAATNKLFLYLLAGLAIAATDVPGQRDILGPSRAMHLYRPGDTRALAEGLALWCRDPQSLRRSREAALRLARERWNWEMEGQRFVQGIADLGLGKTHQLCEQG